MKAYRTNLRTRDEIRSAVKELVGKMTLEEKAGQLYQSVGADITAIGSTGVKVDVETLIREGRIGSMIQVDEPSVLESKIRRLQKIAVEESRLGIPILMCQDVIHGYETVFPIPLAWSCSFDPALIRKCVAAAAAEAGTAGIDLAFSPMVDIVRDPRWGRVCESAGEDPYLGALIARAQVEGFRDGGVLSCLKHFLGYGAAEAGRDYNTVELSTTTMYNTYLKPFAAGIDAGADSVMTAFNVMDGIPMVANRRIVGGLLRKGLGFDGIVISDYGAFMELMNHGVAANGKEAAQRAFSATTDIEMTTNYYLSYIPDMVRSGEISEAELDASVERILTKKYEVGLMDDPYIHCRPEKQSQVIFSREHLALAEKMAEESAVLLENDGVLPLSKDARIALVGPYATEHDHAGAWSFTHRREESVNIYDGLVAEGFKNIATEPATGIFDENEGGIANAVRIAKDSDVVILAVGESSVISGEACSRQDITIPGRQKDLVEAILALGKPTVMVLVTGRPLLLESYQGRLSGLLLAWDLGSMAGHAIAKILSGTVNPSGHLSMSFPRNLGQIPLYYNALNTGRPHIPGSTEHFESKYLDGPNDPLYRFGYGLSYTKFGLSGVEIPSRLDRTKGLCVKADVTNEGSVAGTALCQLYVRDKVARIARPIKELKGFCRVQLQAGETKRISIDVPFKEFGFLDSDFVFHVEPGEFDIFVGFDSGDAGMVTGTTVLED